MLSFTLTTTTTTSAFSFPLSRWAALSLSSVRSKSNSQRRRTSSIDSASSPPPTPRSPPSQCPRKSALKGTSVNASVRKVSWDSVCSSSSTSSTPSSGIEIAFPRCSSPQDPEDDSDSEENRYSFNDWDEVALSFASGLDAEESGSPPFATERKVRFVVPAPPPAAPQRSWDEEPAWCDFMTCITSCGSKKADMEAGTPTARGGAGDEAVVHAVQDRFPIHIWARLDTAILLSQVVTRKGVGGDEREREGDFGRANQGVRRGKECARGDGDGDEELH
ncbi:hypothetical protein C8R43DRAFT_941315 [Mycena crocata]|nr:hypothetical protein C8R43DRAFT_941315 [Mycena crocata]